MDSDVALQEEPLTPEAIAACREYQIVRWKASTEESKQAALKFQPEPSDVIITTSRKAGTTWMTQICHQLRTGGDMDFTEITEVVPFLECAGDLGQNCDDKQRAEPRLYKTHFTEASCPKGGKYITVVRHPYDVVVSQYRYHADWMFRAEDIEMNLYVQQVSLGGSVHLQLTQGYSQWAPACEHYMGWWPRRHDKDVLFVFYEDMKEDLEREVKRVAEFIGVDDTSAVETAVKRSTFDYMSEHREQFNDNVLKAARNIAMGLSPSAGMQCSKVATSGGKRHLLNDRTRALLDAAWARTCLPVTGAKDYDEWRRMWHDEQPCTP